MMVGEEEVTTVQMIQGYRCSPEVENSTIETGLEEAYHGSVYYLALFSGQVTEVTEVTEVAEVTGSATDGA